MRPRFRPLSLVFLVLPACNAPQADTSPFTTTPPATTDTPAASDSSTSSTSTNSGSGGGSEQSSTTGELSTTSTGSAGESTTLILDVGPDMDLGDGKPIGCKGKIDFLFVISRYGGMEGFQAQLLDAFPKFVDTIQEKFSDFDYHIMVVDGDAEWGLDYCTENCPALDCKVGEPCCPLSACPKCTNPINLGDLCCGIEDYPCDYTPTACDEMMGAGVVLPAAGDAANKLCPIDGGRRYMVKGQNDLQGTFKCAAQVGSSGWARMGEALSFAVAPWMNDRGGCNDGFIREDALLMVTLISNTYDIEGTAPSSQQGNPDTWMDAVRKAKHDDLESVVALGILPTDGPGCNAKDRLCQMLELFPYAVNRDIWDKDYGPFFDEAAELVETACAEFIPPG